MIFEKVGIISTSFASKMTYITRLQPCGVYLIAYMQLVSCPATKLFTMHVFCFAGATALDMATVTVLVTCLIVSMIMVHSICNGAPTIANNQDKLNKTASEEGAEMNGTYKYPLLKNGVFEGDIMISEELIRKYYNLSSIPGGEKYYELVAEETDKSVETTDHEGKKRFEKRAAIASTSRLWPSARVPYQFTSNIQTELRHRIRDAMDHWEDRTCLRFTTRDAESDYVEYNNEKRACSSFIGRQGGNQTINVFIDSLGYCSFGSVVHEVGHAIGFWHEQSRPDRDSYVRINVGNVTEGKEHNFMKRSSSQVNSLGVVYDYGSIMHYSKTAFVRDDCDGCQSIEVNNTAVYRAQGSPTIGQRNGLSTKDVQQANLLYSCPRSGVTGLPVIHIKSGCSLPDTDPALNSPDPYVKITAVDSSGVQYTRDTSVKLGTTDPNWNEFLKLPEREWQFFRIKLWDDDDFLTFGDDEMSVSETIVPSLGEHSNIRHCADTSSCSGYVSYDYTMYQLTSALLIVKVRYARNLQDTDPIWNSPDPYVKVEAISSTGSHALSTSYIDGTQNPTWNSNLNFGCRRWANVIQLQVWDSDSGFTGGDDEMSDKQETTLALGNHYSNRHSAHGSGYLIFDYSFIADGNECSGSNPCRNGGICVDGCASYTCTCTSRYTGTHCEHLSGNLRFKARYARNLRDSDGWWNDSDPYMQVIAIDENGNSVTKSTSYLSGDSNPDWNEWLNFGTRGWKQFKVRIYDSDYDADDALSSQYTWNVASGSHTSQRFNCYDNGYAIFDYSFN